MANHLRALLIDDSDLDTELLVGHLEANGYEVDWQRVDTADALRKALAEREWDIALCDYVMPRLGGLEALQILRTEAPDLPAITVSGNIGEEYAVNVMRAGARDYVRKDNLARLIPAIDREMQQAVERRGRAEAEASLHVANASLRLASDAAGIGFFVRDLRTDSLEFSAQWKANLGYAPEEMSAAFVEFESRLHPEDHDRVLSAIAADITAGTPAKELEFRLRHRDGTYRWILSRSVADRDADGSLARIVGVHIDITERKRADEALKASEEKFRSYTERAPLAVIVSDLAGFIVEHNPTAEAMFGASATAAGRHISELHPQEEQARVVEALSALTAGGIVKGNFQMLREDGAPFWASLQVRQIGPDRVLGFCSDITDRRRSEEEKEQYLKFFRLSTDAMCIADSALRFTQVNPAFVRMIGYSEEELLSRPFVDFVVPEDRDATAEEAQHQITARDTIGFENRYLRKDGTILWLSWTAFFDKQERVIYATGHDITKRKQAEEALRTSSERLRLVTETIDEVFWMTDVTISRILYVSPGYERLWGRSCQSLYDDPSSFLAAFHPQDLAQAEAMHAAQENASPYDLEYRIVRPDGSVRWVLDRGFPVRDDAGVVVAYVGVAKDITERKQAEEEVRRLNSELEQRVGIRTRELIEANKELESFNYSVSHDLRAPLRQIDGFIQLVDDRFGAQLPAQARKHLAAVQAASRRTNRMIEALLELSRVGRATLNCHKIELTEMVRAAWHDLRFGVGERTVELIVGDLPEVTGDPVLLRQVFDNLLGNALKFTQPIAKARIEVGVERRDEQQAIFVRDNGVGFDPRYADKLFGVFQRLHDASEFEGTGVGLSIVKRIVEKQGGTVWAESKPGEGATFYFTLPTA